MDAACASSLSAMHLAMLELQTGRADMVLTGGLDSFNDIFMYMCFSKTPALSPTGNARPFDSGADGTILGEGIGVVVLKRLADAERDGDRIYAVIRGIGSSSDGKGKAVYAPDSEGQARALRMAYDEAGVQPSTVELVEAHGTGTKIGDAVEVAGLKSVFDVEEQNQSWCALGSVKSMIGHTKAAAGAAGLIKAALALHHKVIPPTIKVEEPAVEADSTPFYINTEKRPWLARADHPRRAGVSAFGFGGSNFHCVIEEYEGVGSPETIDWNGCTEVLAFSGVDRGEVIAAIAAFDDDASWAVFCRQAAETRKTFDASAPARLTMVIERGGPPVQDVIQGAKTLLDRGESARWSTPTGAYFSSGPRQGKLAALFPGQGTAYVGMLRDLACSFPAAAEALALANEDGLGEIIYPHPAFNDVERSHQAKALHPTQVAQPAIGAVSVTALEVLKHFDVSFDAAAGHSYGELVALHAAGRLTSQELHRLSTVRGELMAADADSPATRCDRGSMLAVHADLDHVETPGERSRARPDDREPQRATASRPLREYGGDHACEVSRRSRWDACYDAQGGGRVSQPARRIGALSVRRKHSRVWELPRGRVPVYSNTTAKTYPDDAPSTRALLASQLASPVEFVEMVKAMYADGVRTFVEIGPGRRLSGLVAEILAEHDDIGTVAIDASAGKKPGALDLAKVLAELAAAGYPVALARWKEPRFSGSGEVRFEAGSDDREHLGCESPR